jgi:hypothetical protein
VKAYQCLNPRSGASERRRKGEGRGGRLLRGWPRVVAKRKRGLLEVRLGKT